MEFEKCRCRRFVLGDVAASVPATIFRAAASGGVEVLDNQGQVIAFVLSPHDREAWIHAEARIEFMNHRDEIRAAAARRGGITTQEMLLRAQQAAIDRYSTD